MFLPAFEHVPATSAEHAVSLLQQWGSAAVVVAGGTELLPRMKQGLIRPGVVVSVRNVPPEPPHTLPDGALVVDALTPLADLARSAAVRAGAPILAEAALAVASRQVRTVATLGGNLCQETRCLYYNQTHRFQFREPCIKRGGSACYAAAGSDRCWAVAMGDTAPALLCLDARVDTLGPAGPRQFPVEGLYSGDAAAPLALTPGEMVVRVTVPRPDPGTGTAFIKYSRRGGVEFAGLTVAAALTVEPEAGTCLRARVAVGAVSSAPVRAREAEAVLTGGRPTEAVLAEAARAAVAEVRPRGHHGYPARYLRHGLEVFARRALARAAARAAGRSDGPRGSREGMT